MTQTIDDTLAERGSRYGEFVDHADVTQSIKEAMRRGRNWECLPDDMKECLEMLAHKAGRILNGDPDYIDSWTDIIGYTRLVEKRLINEQSADKEESSTAKSNEVRIAEYLASLSAALEEDEEPCDDLACNTCHPGIGEALRVLINAGVIKQVD